MVTVAHVNSLTKAGIRVCACVYDRERVHVCLCVFYLTKQLKPDHLVVASARLKGCIGKMSLFCFHIVYNVGCSAEPLLAI